MTKRYEVYKCSVCGNVVEIVEAYAGQLVCCGQPMLLKNANSTDASNEKHVPVIVDIKGGYLVKIGSDAHPMVKEHYIEFIELTVDDIVYKRYLNPEDKPEYEFKVAKGKVVSAREYCNVHGLWKTKT